VSSATEQATKLASLLKKITPSEPKAPEGADLEPVTQLIFSFLLWDATVKQANNALDRLLESFVDFNELRVSHPKEVAEVLGPRYPRVHERSERLLDSLQDVFVRHYGITLEPLKGKSKREAKQYLETLAGAPPYVTARLMLLVCGGHAVPVDDRLLDALRDEGVVDDDATIEQAQSMLERNIKAAEAPSAVAALQDFADARPAPRSRGAASRAPEPAAKSSTQKPTRSRSASRKSTTKATTSKATTGKTAASKSSARKATRKKA